MSTQFNNQYSPSDLVSLDIIHLLGEWNPTFLRYTGTHGMSLFDNDEFVSGKTINIQVGGVPPLTLGSKVYLTPYEQRVISIKADENEMLSVTLGNKLTAEMFYMKPDLRRETISAPVLKALKEGLEEKAARLSTERSPVIPSFGSPLDQEISLPTDSNGDKSFSVNSVAWLTKLKHDLGLPRNSYHLVLNTTDNQYLQDQMIGVYNETITGQSIRQGDIPQSIAGFPVTCSNYLRRHDLKKADQPLTGLYFVSVPSSDDNPIAVLRNTNAPASGGGEDDPNAIWLTGGDILYYKAQTLTPPNGGLHWIQYAVKRPIPDTRFSFCVTSDLYVQNYIAQGGDMRTFKYDSVVYKIPPGEQLEVSLSHMAIPAGFHQNISRAITLFSGDDSAPGGDEFCVLDSHYKNVAINPNYFLMKTFKLRPMPGVENGFVDDPKTKFRARIIKAPSFGEGMDRGEIIDTSMLSVFGYIPQNLFTLPSAAQRSPLTSSSSLKKAGRSKG